MMARSKFNVSSDKSKRTYDGIVFDSALEMRYYRDVLLPLVQKGRVVSYELQKPYELQPKFMHDGKTILPIKYVADFYVIYDDGTEEVVDTKGFPDSVSQIKRKMFWYCYPTVKYSWKCYSEIDGGWCDYAFVEKQRAERRKERKKKKEVAK